MATDKDYVISKSNADTTGINKKRSDDVLKEYRDDTFSTSNDYAFDDEVDYTTLDWGNYVNTQAVVICHNTLGNLEIRDNTLKIVIEDKNVLINTTAVAVSNSTSNVMIDAGAVYLNGPSGSFILRAPNTTQIAAGAMLSANGSWV